MFGARAARSVLLEELGYGADSLGFAAVWIDMLAGGDWDAPVEAAELFAPFPHVEQFYDADRLVGKAVAASLGARGGTAWEMWPGNGLFTL